MHGETNIKTADIKFILLRYQQMQPCRLAPTLNRESNNTSDPPLGFHGLWSLFLVTSAHIVVRRISFFSYFASVISVFC
jgi:hypothetical protein